MASRLLISVEEFCRITNTGRTRAYQLIRERQVKSVKLGARRLIVYASVEALVERLNTEQAR